MIIEQTGIAKKYVCQDHDGGYSTLSFRVLRSSVVGEGMRADVKAGKRVSHECCHL